MALSGGANKGSYEAGILHGLAHNLDSTLLEYDVVTGVSAGAINAGAVVTYPKDKPLELSEWLVETWMNLTNDQCYKFWD